MSTKELKKKFSEIEYSRPDYKKAKSSIESLTKKIINAKKYDDVKKAFLKKEELLEDIGSMFTIASIRATLDTNDKFYEDEDFENQNEYAALEITIKSFNNALLSSPFKNEFIKEFGDLLILEIENGQKLINEAILPNIEEEVKLCQEYDKLVAQCSVEFRGETCNFYGLQKHMESIDRNERKEAFDAWAKLYESVSEKLDEIYDKLVAVRCDKAKKLGFDNFIDYAYLSLQRFDYNKDDVKIFREEVKKYLVPLANKLMIEQKERLGVSEFNVYDEALVFPDGNAIPKGNKDELVSKANEMYHDLSKETGEFFDYMVEHDLFDLETRPGKVMGGYCTFIDSYKAPFIFANFNGTRADVETLTHEAGHAFQAYMASRNIQLLSQTWAGYETSEIHSMSMEHLTYPWMDKFFGENNKKFLYAHIVGSLTCIPYLVSVDEFQHRVFENPTMTALDRRKVWKDIENTYMPWRKYDDNQFLNEGGYWMQKQHIFLDPFYYIDYAIAQTCAYQFLLKDLDNHENAWKDYLTLCKAGGSKRYKELLKLANLNNPLEEGTVEKVVKNVEKVINNFRNNALN